MVAILSWPKCVDVWLQNTSLKNTRYRADSKFVPSQWETALLCNNISHWLGASLESAPQVYKGSKRPIAAIWVWHNFQHTLPGIILGLNSANEIWHCMVMSPLIGWAYNQNHPWLPIWLQTEHKGPSYQRFVTHKINLGRIHSTFIQIMTQWWP